jgi:hypothetical protein
MSNYPSYVRIGQSVLDWHGTKPLTVALVLETAEDINKRSLVATFEEEPPVAWGQGVYRVNEDGSLTLIKSKFDTSG